MDSIIKFFLSFIIGLGVIIILTLINGTILWIIYPHIHALFNTPTILASNLSWWDSVCISWIAQILIKSNNHFSKTK